MSKKTFEENLQVLGIPDRVSFDALVELTPEVQPLKDEMIEVLESIDAKRLTKFIEDENPTELAVAFQRLRTN